VTEDVLASSFKIERYQPDPKADPGHWLEREVIARHENGYPLRCRTDCSVDVLVVPAPEGQALIEYILSKITPPREWLEMMEKVIDPSIDTSMRGALSALGTEHSVPERERESPENAPRPIVLRARRPPEKKIGTTVL
jgi:hypothetical protein